jgi:peptidoglycan hydrolase-like protein with peptidoglycan-binding domain
MTTRAGQGDDASPRDDLVRAIQTELKSLGYYSGTLDGIAGAGTSAAIRAFQSAIGIAESPAATFELLSKLRAARRGELKLAAMPAVEPPHRDERIAAVQTALSRSAYGQLTADGVFGPDTRDAIIRFQRDNGLPVTGTISDALILELRSAGALDGE